VNFKPGYVYHIYNRGNNKQPIFFNDNNYIFFLRKARVELSDFFDFLAYCLMPNHFHFLVQAKDQSIRPLKAVRQVKEMDPIARKIGTLLSSYTQAINKQKNRTGSLFQQKTKAKCLNEDSDSQNNFLPACFQYIHQNPLNAGIVDRLEDWDYSSFPDYAGLRNGTLCNKELAHEMVNYNKDDFNGQSYAQLMKKNLKGIWI